MRNWEGGYLKSWMNFGIIPDKIVDNGLKRGNNIRRGRAESGIIPNF